MNAPLIIRHGTEADIPAMVELLKILFSIEIDFAINAERQDRGLRLILSDAARSCVLVAENEGTVVGMCTGQLIVSTAEGAGSVWVEDVVVYETFRKRGVASALLTHMEAWGQERGATRMQLLVDMENTAALRFYQENNWERTRMICRRKPIQGHQT